MTSSFLLKNVRHDDVIQTIIPSLCLAESEITLILSIAPDFVKCLNSLCTQLVFIKLDYLFWLLALLLHFYF